MPYTSATLPGVHTKDVTMQPEHKQRQNKENRFTHKTYQQLDSTSDLQSGNDK